MVFFNEKSDNIVLAVGSLFGSSCQCLIEIFIGLVISQCFNNIGYGYFKDNVHTALEVQTQVQLLLLTLLVGELAEAQVVNRQVLHRIEVMLFGLALLVEGELRGIRSRLLLYATRFERERELVNACEAQQDRDEFNETFTLLSENRPYYTELQTRKRVTNDFDYFKRLHECIVTKASKELQDAELLNLFEITGVDLTDEELDDFGDKEYILYRIENELNTQFNTRKQLVLKTMYAYIDRRGSLYDTESLSLFGTNTFNLVWEKICADIMDNQLDAPLGVLKLPVPLKDGYNRRMKLIELIEKPLWTITGKCAKDTLIPDLISICKVNGQHQFIIFDAKYYNAHLETGIAPTGQPGIESVTKQYLYQLAYQKFIEDHNFSSVKNCFLLPTENNEIEDKGEVRMEMLSNLGLQDIKGRLIPATMAYDLYLSGRKMDIADLEL